MSTPTPRQAEVLLSQVESNQQQARTHDAWPLVILLLTLSAGLSVALVGFGAIADPTTQLIVFGAGLAWLAPALTVYLIKARSWSRRSTVLLLTWLPLILIAVLPAIIVDTYHPTSWVPYAAAGFLWILAPVMALIGLRR